MSTHSADALSLHPTWQAVSDLAGYATRLCELLAALDAPEPSSYKRSSPTGSGPGSRRAAAAAAAGVLPDRVLLRVEGLGLRFGDGRQLIEGVSLQVRPHWLGKRCTVAAVFPTLSFPIGLRP